MAGNKRFKSCQSCGYDLPAFGIIEIGRGCHAPMRGSEQLFSCAAVVILGRRLLIRVNGMAVAQ